MSDANPGVDLKQPTYLLNGCHDDVLDRFLKCHYLLDLLWVFDKQERSHAAKKNRLATNTRVKRKLAPLILPKTWKRLSLRDLSILMLFTKRRLLIVRKSTPTVLEKQKSRHVNLS